MNLLFLSSTFHPYTGGAETYMRLLAQGAAAAGHQVTVLTDGSRLPELPAEEESEGYRLVRLRTFAAELDRTDTVLWRRMQFALLDELGELSGVNGADLVHANSHETLVHAVAIALDAGIPLAASLHEQNPDLGPFGHGRCRLSYQVLPVDAYFTGSRFYDERAMAYGAPRERTHLIYHGVPIPGPDPALRAAGRARYGLEDDDVLLLCPGRIDPRKAQLDLAEALPAVVSGRRRVRVLLAGRDTDHAYAARLRARLQELRLQEVVRIQSDLTNRTMDQVYAASDIVVQPSLEEGLGLAAIEAMSWARPVVATDVVGLNEVVTHDADGLLVPVSTPPALADALTALIADPSRAQRLGAAARETVRQRFSQQAMVDRHLEIYASLCAARTGTTAA
ncbi:glycosyltransferase family 4 protein [Streptomyces sp. NPDC054770]